MQAASSPAVIPLLVSAGWMVDVFHSHVLPVEQNRWQWMCATTDTHQLIQRALPRKKKKERRRSKSEVGTSRQPPSSTGLKEKRKWGVWGSPSASQRYTDSLQLTRPEPLHSGLYRADPHFTVRSYPSSSNREEHQAARCELGGYRKPEGRTFQS